MSDPGVAEQAAQERPLLPEEARDHASRLIKGFYPDLAKDPRFIDAKGKYNLGQAADIHFDAGSVRFTFGDGVINNQSGYLTITRTEQGENPKSEETILQVPDDNFPQRRVPVVSFRGPDVFTLDSDGRTRLPVRNTSRSIEHGEPFLDRVKAEMKASAPVPAGAVA